MICGIDEVGRGPLAGPVVAVAVCLPVHFPYSLRTQLADSKAITPQNRTRLAYELWQHVYWADGWVWHYEIDQINIHNATLKAMALAYNMLCHTSTLPISQVVVDGKFIPPIDHNHTSAVIKGDTFITEIQAASIIAKVLRDQWMCLYDLHEPQYGFTKHKGYPTLQHKTAIKTFGHSKIQRISFKSI